MSASELKVFVSHSNADNEFTRRLVADLRNRGATVWVDFDDIDTGDFAATINQGMDNCDWMVVVLTPASLKSKWVVMEVNAAMNMKADGYLKGVVPIVAAPFQPVDLPPIWRTLQRYDATEDYDRAFNGLCKALGLAPPSQNEPAQLTVNVSPSGARVFVDGVEAHGPMSVAMEKATKKTVVIEVSKYGYNPKRLNLELASGENRVLELELEEKPVSTEPDKLVKKPPIDRRLLIGGPIIAIVGVLFALRPHSRDNLSNTNNSPNANVATQSQNTPETKRILQGWIGDPTLIGPSGSVNSVAFSVKGDSFVTGGEDKIVRFWEIATRKLHFEFQSSHIDGITSVAFSLDGTTLATASRDSSICLWEVRTGKSLGSLFAGHIGRVNSVAFSPDGSILASASNDKTICLWDVKSLRQIGEHLSGHTDRVNSVAFSLDGSILASGSDDNTIRLWDVKSRKTIGDPLTGHKGPVITLAFSPNGSTLATGSGDKSIRLWDVQTKKPLGEPLLGHEGAIISIAFSPGGTMLISGSNDTTVRLWDVQLRKALGEPLLNPGGEISSVAYSPDGNTIAAGNGRDTVQFWHPKG